MQMVHSPGKDYGVFTWLRGNQLSFPREASVITRSDAQGLRDHEQQVSETATNNCIPQPEPETGTSLHCRTSSSHQPCLPASLMRVSPFQEVQQQFYGTAPAHKFVVVSAKQTSMLTYKHIQTVRKMKAFPKKNTVL